MQVRYSAGQATCIRKCTGGGGGGGRRWSTNSNILTSHSLVPSLYSPAFFRTYIHTHTHKKKNALCTVACCTLLSLCLLTGTVSSALPQWEASSSQVPIYSQSPSAVALQDQPGPSQPSDLTQGKLTRSSRPPTPCTHQQYVFLRDSRYQIHVFFPGSPTFSMKVHRE